MQNTPANPYQNLTAVRDAGMFIGRNTVLRRLYSAVASRQCISLVGPRHIGKSSLLTCMLLPEIQKRFEYDLSKHIFVSLDLRKYRKNTGEFFGESVSKQIMDQCQEPLEPALFGSKKGLDAFSFVLEQMTNKGHKLVLVMDSFDYLTRNKQLDFDFFSYLRAEAQIAHISYITSSVAPLYDMSRQDVRESPFFNIFDVVNVGPLTQNEVQELITKPSQRMGCPFNEVEQEWISSLAGRHPFFIQRVCYFLFEEKCDLEPSALDLQRVEELVYAQLRPHFVTLLEDLPVDEQKQLEEQVRRNNTQDKMIHPELSESSLFLRYLREKYAIHISQVTTQMTVQNFGKILKHVGDLPVLGETPLKYLKAVSDRLTNPTPSSIEAGRVIRQFLVEMLDHLKGSGVQNDRSVDWRLYNILYYRYFQPQRFKGDNEQLATRLGYTSVRQFYRDQEKAIKLLFQEVLDRETHSVEYTINKS